MIPKLFGVAFGGVLLAACAVIPSNQQAGDERVAPSEKTLRLAEETQHKPLQRDGPVLSCQETLGWHISEREYVCPIGGEKFTSLTLGTHSTYGRYLDWEPVSYLEFPMPVPVCPSNGFVIYKEDFSDREISILETAIKSKEYQKDFRDKNASYFLFGRLLEVSGLTDGHDLWWLFLNSTWEADQCQSDKYSRYVSKTIDAAKTALLNYSEDDFEYWIVNIIIPNLYRRSGQFTLASAWLEKLGDNRPGENIEGRDFINLAFEILEQAITDKDVGQIPIEKPDNEEE